jgi:hypothetical protein
MKTRLACSAFAVAVLLALMLPATAQRPAGGTGAIASIPSSVYRAAEQARPVTLPGILGIIAGPPPPSPDLDPRQAATRRGPSPAPSK